MTHNLSILGLDDLALAELKRCAQQQDISVNDLVLRLIDQGLRLQRVKPALQRKHDLDALAGQWQAVDAQAFEAATGLFTAIDPGPWR